MAPEVADQHPREQGFKLVLGGTYDMSAWGCRSTSKRTRIQTAIPRYSRGCTPLQINIQENKDSNKLS